MKRPLRLFIGGLEADIDAQSLILFTYTAELLNNPAVVKNSYSKQITLKGTPANDRIFGKFWRLDRLTKFGSGFTGSEFDPSRKTPFVIYAGGTDVIESGYIKLDSVKRDGGVASYQVTLYGGLGSFFYSLSYDENGNKRTLADLRYTPNDPETELDFVMNNHAVAQAWDRLILGSGAQKWSVINFAPCYNGIPDAIDATKALIKPQRLGLPDQDGAFKTLNGYALASLGRAYTEQATKDMRSYLQRPVLSVQALFEAIARPENNGGRKVVLDPSFFNASNPYYSRAWITLPSLTKATIVQSSKSFELNLPATTQRAGDYHINIPFVQSVPEASVASVKLRYRLRYVGDVEVGNSAFLTSAGGGIYTDTGLLVQVVGYNSLNQAIAGSPVRAIMGKIVEHEGHTTWNVSQTSEVVEALAGAGYQYLPEVPTAGFGEVVRTDLSQVGGSLTEFVTDELVTELAGTDVQRVAVRVVPFLRNHDTASGDMHLFGGVADNQFVVNNQIGVAEVVLCQVGLANGIESSEVTVKDPDTVRTGVKVTKKMILTTESTPLDYVLSYCKQFRLSFVTDKVTGTVTIASKSEGFQNQIIDMSERIDQNGIEIKPLQFDAKWYELALTEVGGEFMQYYKATQGEKFGAKRIDTGYDFNATTKNLLEGNIYKSASEVLEQSRYMLTITSKEGRPVPAVFLDGGMKYTLFDDLNNKKDIDIPAVRSDANIRYFNEELRGYDAFSKLQLHGEDDKSLNGDGVLVFFKGAYTGGKYTAFRITDDLPEMELLAGKPCWILDVGVGLNVVAPPVFGRYLMNGNKVARSWDYGVPAVVDIPDVVYDENSTIYGLFWREYMEDRFDVDTKTVVCMVDTRGMQIDETALKRIYRFEGNLWILNKVTDFDISSESLTKCEFVKIKQSVAYVEPVFEVDQDTFILEKVGESVSFNVKSDREWTITTDGEQFQYMEVNDRGTDEHGNDYDINNGAVVTIQGDAKLFFLTEKNINKTFQKITTIRLSNGVKEIQVQIVQPAMVWTAVPSSINTTGDRHQIQIKITHNWASNYGIGYEDWRIFESVVPSSEDGVVNITAVLRENTTGEDRQGYIYMDPYMQPEGTQYINVTQRSL